MKILTQKPQSGFALLLFVLVIFGLGGMVFAGYSGALTRALEKNRLDHDKQVLQEAKQALLMYAFRYPDFGGGGPGRLPCTDGNNDGLTNGTSAECEDVGRLPVSDLNLNFFDARDSSGERLWYAVSEEFRNSNAADVALNNNGDDVVNSDSIGTISIFSQPGTIIFDGAVNGVAAVIIAPGPAIRRDNNNDGIYEYNQVRGTAAQQNNPRNYLDTFGGFDNRDFVNGSNAIANSFIHGPIVDGDLNPLVNDRMIVITTDEIVAMAEKAVLHTYKDAIREYQQNVGPLPPLPPIEDHYPWLDDLNSVNPTTTDTAEVGTRVGQVPSIYFNYFDNTTNDDSQWFRSDIRFHLDLTVAGFPISKDLLFNSNASVRFEDGGDLRITPAEHGHDVIEHYWDHMDTPTGWKPCPSFHGDEHDCNQDDDNPGVPDPHVSNEVAMRLLEITYDNNLGTNNSFTKSYNQGSGSNLFYIPPNAADHAYVYFEYNEDNGDEINIGYKYDHFYLVSFDDTFSDDHVPYWLGVEYMPVLEDWVLSNNWHNSIVMAMSEGFQPGATPRACNTDGTPPVCLTVLNTVGEMNNKKALLMLASEHGIFDGNGNGIEDDLINIFGPENADIDDNYDARLGDDVISILND